MGEYVGVPHVIIQFKICNLKCSIPKEIPVAFKNGLIF